MRFSIPAILLASTISAAEIPAGAHVLLRVQNTVNSRTAQPGDYVYFQTATPIASGGTVVVPMGSYVQGIVAEVARPGKVKGRAELSIRLETLTLASGQQYKFEPRVASLEGDPGGQRVVDRENTIKQGSDVGKDVARVAIMAGGGAALGAMVSRIGNNNSALQGAGIGSGAGAAVGLATTLLTRGREVELRQGSSLDVVFDRPVAIQ